MEELKYAKCGNVIETIPLICGLSIEYNEETQEFECYLGEQCGYVPLSRLVCEKCTYKC